MNSGGINAEMATGCAYGVEVNSIDNYRHQVASVFASLNMRSNPPTVIGFVVPAWVFPIYLVNWARLNPHIPQECGERGIPFIAQDYPPASVLGIILALGVVAPPFNTEPSLVLWACIASLLVSVSNYARHINLMSYVVNCSKSPLTRQEAHV